MGSTTNGSLDVFRTPARLSRFQVTAIVLCALVAVLDGFDTQSISLAAPGIAAAWRLPAADFGVVFSLGLLGSLIGSVISGFVSDRLGRRPVLLAAVALFSAVTMLTPVATGVGGLAAIRVVTGLGLGAALPCVVAITAEYAPARMRNAMVALMFAGYPFGAVVGGLLSAALIPAYGWPSPFLLVGGASLVLLPVLWFRLPESARFLASRGDREAAERLARQAGFAVSLSGLAPEPAEQRSRVIRLFTGGRAAGTVTLFLSLLITYLLTSWLPILAGQSGLGVSKSIIAVVSLNFGSIVGSFLIGRLADRVRTTAVVGGAYALGSLAIAAIGFTGGSSVFLLATSFVAGGLSLGAQMTAVALSASFYETSLRGTGVGWTGGVGRVGSIVGPLLGGLLIGGGVGARSLFFVAGLASLAAAVAILILDRIGITAREE
jgi:AAHS family 4-hydroxybenzoate transporter-like MFS transporter